MFNLEPINLPYNIEGRKVCPICGGTGEELVKIWFSSDGKEHASTVICETCDGRGWIDYDERNG